MKLIADLNVSVVSVANFDGGETRTSSNDGADEETVVVVAVFEVIDVFVKRFVWVLIGTGQHHFLLSFLYFNQCVTLIFTRTYSYKHNHTNTQTHIHSNTHIENMEAQGNVLPY